MARRAAAAAASQLDATDFKLAASPFLLLPQLASFDLAASAPATSPALFSV